VLALDIEPSGLHFVEKGGQFEARLEIRHLATDARNKLFPEFRHPATLTLAPAVHQRINENGLRVVSEFVMPPGRYQLRVASAGAVQAGSVVYDLDVPDFGADALAMSGMILTSEKAGNVFTMQADVGDRYSKPKDCRPPVCVAEVRRGRSLTQWTGQGAKASFSWTDALSTPPTTARAFSAIDTVTAFVEVYHNRKEAAADAREALE
jgi:hypothetical protein